MGIMLVADFDYELPESAIAQSAIEPRDSSRLLVTSAMTDHHFADLPGLLEPGDVLVVNRTRVRAARLFGSKPATGGSVELLLTRRIDTQQWEGLVRPARRIKPGTELDFGQISGIVLAGPDRGAVAVELVAVAGDVEDLLPSIGEVPLPPYFRGELADPERYQTMFAKGVGSAAAPTAGLHFTPGVVQDLSARGIPIGEIELEVGLDTFRPMGGATIAEHQIHAERYRVPEATAALIEKHRSRGGRVVAVGTTVVRTLESAAGGDGAVRPGEGEATLFIVPGYRFRAVDAVVTNFHAPRTTLLAMIAAMVGPRWREMYMTALERGYRFLSFGDAMLIPEVGSIGG